VDIVDIVTAPWDLVNWVLDEAFLLLKDLFDRFGPPIVFAGALAEATVGLGVVFPGTALIILAAAFSAERGTPLPLIYGLAVAGTLLGDTISYGLGRWGARWLEGTRFAPTLRVGEVLIGGRARWLIPFYHLHSWTRAVGPVGAGALRLPLRVWMPLDYLGVFISNGVWVGVGGIFGAAVLTEDGTLEDYPPLRAGLAAAAVLWLLIARRAVRAAQRRIARQASDSNAAEPAGSPVPAAADDPATPS
jgi:membrane protein DedA with SNARE-associated domain